jgi:hypothetical protein
MTTYAISNQEAKDASEESTQVEKKEEQSLNKETEKKEPQHLIIETSGSLGEVYTRALNVVYANDNPIKPEEQQDNFSKIKAVSKESAANDHPSIAEKAIISNDIKEHDMQIGEPKLFVYATDSEKITEGPINDIFDNLRDIAETKNNQSIVVIEGNRHISKNQVVLEDFLNENKIPIYHQRKSAIAGIIKKAIIIKNNLTRKE